jgi:copper chaperone
MLTLDVPDISCAHCERAVKEAVASVAPDARVSVDLPAHRVTVEGAEAARVIAALAEAGYPATQA